MCFHDFQLWKDGYEESLLQNKLLYRILIALKCTIFVLKE